MKFLSSFLIGLFLVGSVHAGTLDRPLVCAPTHFLKDGTFNVWAGSASPGKWHDPLIIAWIPDRENERTVGFMGPGGGLKGAEERLLYDYLNRGTIILYTLGSQNFVFNRWKRHKRFDLTWAIPYAPPVKLDEPKDGAPFQWKFNAFSDQRRFSAMLSINAKTLIAKLFLQHQPWTRKMVMECSYGDWYDRKY